LSSNSEGPHLLKKKKNSKFQNFVSTLTNKKNQFLTVGKQSAKKPKNDETTNTKDVNITSRQSCKEILN
jgi:hypothetical protein